MWLRRNIKRPRLFELKSAISARNLDSDYRTGGAVTTKLKFGIIAIALACSAVGGATWISDRWWVQQNPQDFEQCSEEVERATSSNDERNALIAKCRTQFVGRRDIGGGYTFFDFLQNRKFHIAGPNPTPAELKYFDQQYMLFLDAQARDESAASLPEQPARTAQSGTLDDPGMSPSSAPGLPMVITPPPVPIPRARSSVILSKRPCEDASLSCSWTKFSAGIKKLFNSNAKIDPN